MSLRMLFRRIRPDFCRIGLFLLNFRHLSKRMLFARCRKQKDAERNSDDALAKERTHNALAQLSVSAAMRKDESDRRARRIIRPRLRPRVRARVRGRERVVIERRLHGVTITRGGPHRKTQRMERSVRSRSAFCRHVALLCADFLHAERYTVVVLV